MDRYIFETLASSIIFITYAGVISAIVQRGTSIGEFVTKGTFNCHIVNYGLCRSKARKLRCRTHYSNVK